MASKDESAVIELPESKKKLSVAEQFERNQKIVADKMRSDPYPVIAERHGVSIRRCKQIVKEWQEQNPTLASRDPVAIISDLLDGYFADLADLNQVFREAGENHNAKIGAINARVAVRGKITELCQAVDLLPHELGQLRIHIDTQVVIQVILGVIERHKLPPEIEEEILAELGGPPPQLSAAN